MLKRRRERGEKWSNLLEIVRAQSRAEGEKNTTQQSG
jgi:hypothetical protein